MRSSSVISRLKSSATRVRRSPGVLLLQLGQLVLDDLADAGRVGEDVLELGDELDDREVLVLDLLALEGGQAGQPHVEDGLRLELGQVEAAHQVGPGVVDLGRLADGLDDRVEVVEGDLEALEDVRPGARLAEVELGPAPDDLAPMVEVVDEHARSGSVCGWPSTSASMFMLNASCIGVCLNRLFRTLCGLASRLSSM
jgi:hypothetical protein